MVDLDMNEMLRHDADCRAEADALRAENARLRSELATRTAQRDHLDLDVVRLQEDLHEWPETEIQRLEARVADLEAEVTRRAEAADYWNRAYSGACRERDTAQRHAREHHLEACETCAAGAGQRDAAEARVAEQDEEIRRDNAEITYLVARVQATDESVMQLVRERDALRLSRLDRDDPRVNVLRLLAAGEISTGKACEALNEIAEGGAPTLPPPIAPDTYDDLISPLAQIARLTARIKELETLASALMQWVENKHPEDFREGLWDAIPRVSFFSPTPEEPR